MNYEKRKKIIKEAAVDDVELVMLAKLCAEAEEAKSVLRKKGYGWMGLDLLQTAQLVPESEDN